MGWFDMTAPGENRRVQDRGVIAIADAGEEVEHETGRHDEVDDGPEEHRLNAGSRVRVDGAKIGGDRVGQKQPRAVATSPANLCWTMPVMWSRFAAATTAHRA